MVFSCEYFEEMNSWPKRERRMKLRLRKLTIQLSEMSNSAILKDRASFLRYLR